MKIKDMLKDKKKFLIIESVCLVLLLVFGYIGLGTFLKGTSAATDFTGGSVKITGTNQVGKTLTAVVTDTTPAADSYEYDWYYSYDSDYSDGGVLISGAKSKTFTIPEIIPGSSAATFVDKYIYVKVYASKTGYASKYLTDITDSTNNGSATVKVKEVKQDFSGGSVKITGTNQVGKTLTAVVTDTNPAATYTYQWYYSYDSDYSDGGVVINGARSSTYTIADTIPGSSAATFVDKYIYVEVFASKEGYNGKYLKDMADASNNGSAKVKAKDAKKDFSGGSVKITGTNQVGKTLTAVVTDTNPAAMYTYQWYYSYDSDYSDGGVVILGAKSSTYTIADTIPGSSAATFVDKYIYVEVFASKEGYNGKYLKDMTDSSNNGSAKVKAKTATATSEDTSPSKYTITYNANGGTGAPNSQTKTHGTNLTLSTTRPTRSNYTFKNWNTAKDGSGTSYAAGATYSANVSTTLYAQWTYVGSSGGNGGNADTGSSSTTYKATFNANGGTLNGNGSLECTTSNSSCSISGLPTATKNGHTFKGWGNSSSCTSGSTSSLTLSGDTTYYACYVEQSSSSGGGNNDAVDDSNNNNNNDDYNDNNDDSNNDVSDDSVDDDNNSGTGDVSNPQTGEASIIMVFLVGTFAIGYAIWYFKNSKINKED